MDGPRGLQCEHCVIMGVGPWLPEIDVRLVPDFPDDPLAAEVACGRGGEAGERGAGGSVCGDWPRS